MTLHNETNLMLSQHHHINHWMWLPPEDDGREGLEICSLHNPSIQVKHMLQMPSQSCNKVHILQINVCTAEFNGMSLLCCSTMIKHI